VGGLTEACVERAEEIYGLVCDQLVRVSTLEAAEPTKLLENIFRSVNIALVNELAMLTDRMGIDIWEVVDAAATKPYGFMRFEHVGETRCVVACCCRNGVPWRCRLSARGLGGPVRAGHRRRRGDLGRELGQMARDPASYITIMHATYTYGV
jgi:UDP-glucose/GDP-mannose dehydrogenase family, central domain